MKKSIAVLASHHALLQAIYTYQLLTTEQLRRICGYSKGSLTRVQTLVKQLVDHNYLLALPRPVTRGKAPFVYTLARKGMNYLKDAGFSVREYFRPSKEQEKSYLFLSHTLSLNDVLIAAALLSKKSPAYSLSTMKHERLLKQTPFKIQIEQSNKSETITLIPDTFLDFRKTILPDTQERIPVLLELDRGTTEQKNFRKKLRALIHFIESGAFKEAFFVNTITIAFATTQGHKRLLTMLDWIRKEPLLTNESHRLSQLFLFTSLPDGEIDPQTLFLTPVWFTPFSNLPVALLAE